jgi:hypothetical protein
MQSSGAISTKHLVHSTQLMEARSTIGITLTQRKQKDYNAEERSVAT